MCLSAGGAKREASSLGITMSADMITEGAGQASGVRSIAVRTGATFTIHLWEDRTRGELWVPSYDPQSLVLVSDDFLRTADGNAVEAGQRTFEFQAVTPGIHRLVFEKRMGWKFTAEDRRVFLVTVSNETGCAGGT
jgi:predicted secreted protein